MPWASSVPAILYQLLPGQEAGNAAAAAIFGLVNPSGRCTVLAAWNCFRLLCGSVGRGHNLAGSSFLGRAINDAQIPRLAAFPDRVSHSTMIPSSHNACRQAPRVFPQQHERHMAVHRQRRTHQPHPGTHRIANLMRLLFCMSW